MERNEETMTFFILADTYIRVEKNIRDDVLENRHASDRNIELSRSFSTITVQN